MSRIKRETNISWTTATIGRGREKVFRFKADRLFVRSDGGKRGKFSADNMKGFGNLRMWRAFQGFGEMVAVEEVLAAWVKGCRAKGTVGVLKCRW